MAAIEALFTPEHWRSFVFLYPYAGLLALAPPLMLLLPETREGAAPVIHFPAAARLREAFGGGAGNTARLPRRSCVLWAVWLCFTLAAMRPEFAARAVPLKREARDIMLAADVSGSMRALDFSTDTKIISRLDEAKRVVADFARGRTGDRVGLIVFGEQAFLNIPLTSDVQTVSKMLELLEPGVAGDGTAIGDAIGEAIRVLRDRPEKSRALILLTDGANTAGAVQPEKAAELAAEYGIRVHTVAVGKGGIVPYPNDRGGVSMVNIPIDEASLKEIARATGGRFYRADDASSLRRVYRELDKLESNEDKPREWLLREPLYMYPLGAGLALLALLTLFPLPPGKSINEKGRI